MSLKKIISAGLAPLFLASNLYAANLKSKVSNYELMPKQKQEYVIALNEKPKYSLLEDNLISFDKDYLTKSKNNLENITIAHKPVDSNLRDVILGYSRGKVEEAQKKYEEGINFFKIYFTVGGITSAVVGLIFGLLAADTKDSTYQGVAIGCLIGAPILISIGYVL